MRLVFNKLAIFCIALLAPSVNAAPLTTAKITIHTREGDLPIQTELALTDAERYNGLMFRDSLEDKHGMLFVYESPSPISMWMRNTFISLDILFINDKGVVNYIKERATPQSDASITSPHLTRYVLELPAGTVEQYSISVGDKVMMPSDIVGEAE